MYTYDPKFLPAGNGVVGIEGRSNLFLHQCLHWQIVNELRDCVKKGLVNKIPAVRAMRKDLWKD